ncbi:MAG: ATP-binding protein [Myxococcales bacterium]|nr:ATP-binding protein [Myxococcales bacterium]
MSTSDIVIAGLLALCVVGIIWLIASRHQRMVKTRLRAVLRGDDEVAPAVISAGFISADLPDLHLALERFRAGCWSHELIGCNPVDATLHQVLHGLGGIHQVTIAAVHYVQVEVGFRENLACVESGLFLLRTDDGTIVARLYRALGSESSQLDVVSRPAKLAQEFLETLREDMRQHSVYRGKVLTVTPSPNVFDSDVKLTFSQLPRVDREQIVLPEETMRMLERNTVSFFRHTDALRRSGRSLRRGLLLHGEPGTGKTFTAKWLAHALEDVTVFLLSAQQLAGIGECFKLARRLQPSLMIIEDVDLIAQDRELSMATVNLHELMNEMDGLAGDSEVMVLMTTNRPDVIEKALASRPGRVDQTIEFPLPDDDCRSRLIDLYCEGLELELADRQRVINKTKGASPAFIKELVRKAALFAAERTGAINTRPAADEAEGASAAEDDAPLGLCDADFSAALEEMLIGGGKLTRSILGFRSS